MATAFESRFGHQRGISFPAVRGIPPLAPVRPRGIRRLTDRYSLADYLAEGSAGATSLERIVAGAAREAGIVFDAAQVTIHLPWGGYTRIDFVIASPLTAIYVDGIQHELRPETAWRDKVIRQQLRSMGWRVAALSWRDIMQDPIAAVRQIVYAQ